MIQEKFYTAAQAAKELGLHPVYVRLLCERGKIHAVKNSPRGYWHISIKELRRYKSRREAMK